MLLLLLLLLLQQIRLSMVLRVWHLVLLLVLHLGAVLEMLMRHSLPMYPLQLPLEQSVQL